ncbi:Putative acyclic terpene utilization [Septoria linicola]|uniref:Acyclic terpene utilization n=1 Tax=Septoria linicola TaxID=215465 RepID=A0A9Q9B396_9PEZI|nr:Putative acyclic terpene utilization [Septoria linicola]
MSRETPCLGSPLEYSIMAADPTRPIRIAGVSGSVSDRRHAMAMFAKNYDNDPIDVIIGDFMSEANMTTRGASKADTIALPAAKPSNTDTGFANVMSSGATDAYEPTFLEALGPALPHIAKHKIKVAVNAGASDTEKMHKVVSDMCAKAGLDLKVAWISGDEVFPAVQKARQNKSSKFENVCTGEVLDDWQHEPIYAQAYLGGLGIAAAFSKGADIVVCGRVSDASPVIGAAYWWHGWTRDMLHELANAFVAGHMIECSNYVVGGNFSGFKSLQSSNWKDIGYPIAEISRSGNVVITKGQGWGGGEVSVQTCSSQLLYEIQGPWYFNSDVTAVLGGMWFEQIGTDRVALRGVTGDLPPPTTKVGITAKGGFQAEVHWLLCGLDIKEKAAMMEAQLRHAMRPFSDKFTMLKCSINGSAAENPRNQNEATVDFRVFVQAKEEADIAPSKFLRTSIDCIMQGYPGATFHLDIRQGFPKAFYEYYVTLLPQSEVEHKVHLWDGTSIEVPPPTETKTYPSQQPSSPYATGLEAATSFGETTRGPLGWIVHARSGDKGSNANVGFWVRHRDEYDWLRSLLSVHTIKGLLQDEYNEKKIDRFELPNMLAVHFLLHDHLDRGVSSSSTYDFLGKNVAEYLRSKWVDLPVRFLNRGKL